MSSSSSSIRNVLRLFPELTHSLHKGQSGRICVIGGSVEYTGAPFFSAISAMRIGADLSYVFCHPSASPVIKSFSPELIVYPTLLFDEMRSTLDKMHSLVFGAGLGRDKAVGVPLLKQLLNYVRGRPSKCCMVIDADGLFMLPDSLSKERPAYTNVLLTPNTREFQRLFEEVLPNVDFNKEAEQEENVKRLASELKMSIMLKGSKEVISDGEKVLIGDHQGSPRRCGGLGDILGGASALFVHWHKCKRTSSPSCSNGDYSVEDLLEGAKAASDFVRYVSNITFEKMGRSMVAGDVIATVPQAVRAIEKGE